jgi:hypothetical protein
MDDTTLLTPAQAAARLPRRNGKKLHARTVKRWMIQGRLDGARKGGAWYTTIAAIRRFQAKNDCRETARVEARHTSHATATITLQNYRHH